MKTERDEKLEEVAIVTTTNTVIHPRTVMVKHLDAVVAYTAVRTARRPIKFASCTPFHSYSYTMDLYTSVQRIWQFSIFYELIASSWINTRVHKCSKTEICNDEDCQQALVDGNPIMVCSYQVRTYKNKKQTGTTEKKQPGTGCGYDLGRRLTRRHSTHQKNENSSKFHSKTPSFRISVMAATKLAQVRFFYNNIKPVCRY